MKNRWQHISSLLAVAFFGFLALYFVFPLSAFEMHTFAQSSPTPSATPGFDQAATLAKLREQIKGREKEPASVVFKNVQTMKDRPAGQLLAVMQFGYARSLGVDCTHCHVPDKWESEEKPQKQIARDMSAMAAKINGDLLKNIKNLKSETPTINCTTCHRGEVKPALNLPQPVVKPAGA